LKLSFRPYTLQLKNSFGLAHGTRNTTAIVLTQLEHKGIIGCGEASLPPYHGETQESVKAFLSKLELEQFEDINLTPDPSPSKREEPEASTEIAKIISYIDKIEKGNNAAKASIDIALHDLVGKILRKPCYELFGIKTPEKKLSSYTIAIDELSTLPKKIKEAKDFKILKIKLGTKEDEKIVHIVKNECDKPLYADANQGWNDKSMALEMLYMLSENGFEVVEQPMPVNCADDDMMWLKEKSPLPLLADESVKRFTDMEKAAELFHGINIKLMKSTGMAEAHKMIVRARELNMKIMLGCMTETSCAILAASHLAPLADYVDLDGPFLINNNPFKNPELIDGCIITPEKPGIGLDF
jgi:L-alanine-DL-glutamate epimerase-like enolase superfamily enzyme